MRGLERKIVNGGRGKCGEAPAVATGAGKIERAEDIVFGQTKRIGSIILHGHVASEAVIDQSRAAAEHAAFSKDLRSRTVTLGAVCEGEAGGEVLSVPGEPARLSG